MSGPFQPARKPTNQNAAAQITKKAPKDTYSFLPKGLAVRRKALARESTLTPKILKPAVEALARVAWSAVA